MYAQDPADLEGYGTDPILSNEQVLDWSKRLVLNLLPLDARKLKLFPEAPVEFRCFPQYLLFYFRLFFGQRVTIWKKVHECEVLHIICSLRSS